MYTKNNANKNKKREKKKQKKTLGYAFAAPKNKLTKLSTNT